MKVMILGGDGFCGWPNALHLSSRGHDVIIVDNLSRRTIDIELGVQSLTPIKPISDRIAAWKEVSGHHIKFVKLDIAKQYELFFSLLESEKPESIIHFAEQRSAPYSMKSSSHKRYTVENNINSTHNVLAAIVESGLDVHLVHLGTMGVYGYGTAGMKIPEGYIDVTIETPKGPVSQNILYPSNPGSIYHMTKTQDQLLFQFYVKNDSVRITDLHQGIVWGTQTEETRRDDRLVNRFDYDGDFGTVLNRFLVQGAVGYPLTVHGTGGQTRAFINIVDSCKCIELALKNAPGRGDRVNILNQMTETHRVRDLASMIARKMGARVQMVENPRLEASENELGVRNDRFVEFGLQSIKLDEGITKEISEVLSLSMDRIDKDKILCRSLWRQDMAESVIESRIT